MEYLGTDKVINKIKPDVSVIVLAYQHSPYIEKCIQSMMEQKTNFVYEIIIGEDESTDGTRQICIEYAEKYPNKIRLFLRNRKDVLYINGNPTGRFNFIENLKAVRGKYIALCDGDDYWIDPYKLQKQVDFLENNPSYVMTYHPVIFVDEYHQQFSKSNGKVKIKNIKDLLTSKIEIYTGSVVYKNVLKKFPKWCNEVFFGDHVLFVLLARNGDLKSIPENMSAYRIHTSNVVSNTTSIKWAQGNIEFFNYLYKELPEKFHGFINTGIFRHHKKLIGSYCENGFYTETTTSIKNAIKLNLLLSIFSSPYFLAIFIKNIIKNKLKITRYFNAQNI